jgi:hypothetical protein
MHKIFLTSMIYFSFSFSFLSAQDIEPLQQQNVNTFYKSFSLGMGITYSNNPSVLDYIENDVPNYSVITSDSRLSEFSTGVKFFAGAEFQVKKKFSVKADYSYHIKSFEVQQFTTYQYTIHNHEPTLMGYYLIQDEYSFIKLGLGLGYVQNSFTRTLGALSRTYSSNGFKIKSEGIINLQLGKNVSSLISGEIFHINLSDLKIDNDYLLNTSGEKVNANSFGAGVNLGIEFYIF